MSGRAAIGLLTLLCLSCAPRLTIVSTSVVEAQRHNPAPGTPLAVVVDPEAKPIALYEQLASEIGATLRGQGFEIVPVDDAEGLVFFQFGSTRSSARPVKPGGTIGTTRPASAPASRHYFRIALVDAAPYREDGTERVVWKGQAMLLKRSRNPGRSDEQALAILGLLRDAALESFGKNRRRTAVSHVLERAGG